MFTFWQYEIDWSTQRDRCSILAPTSQDDVVCNTSSLWLKSPKIALHGGSRPNCSLAIPLAHVKGGDFARNMSGVEKAGTNVTSCSAPYRAKMSTINHEHTINGQTTHLGKHVYTRAVQTNTSSQSVTWTQYTAKVHVHWVQSF